MTTDTDGLAALGPAAQYHAWLDAGELRIQRSRSTGHYVFEPRTAEPFSGSRDLEWVSVSGLGVVYSISIVRPRSPAEPYPIVLVDLDEGVRLMSVVLDTPPEAIVIGLRVRARVAQHLGQGRIEFTPVEAGSPPPVAGP